MSITRSNIIKNKLTFTKIYLNTPRTGLDQYHLI